MSPQEPSRLGRYELLETIGRGAMGVVYKAHDSFLDRVVAVKTYRQDATMSENLRRRFEREVKTASKLLHPNIVTVYDGGLEGEVPFLAMEFVEGTTLETELKSRGRLPIREAVAMLDKVAEGLAYAHQQGVIHRDLKPANILLAADRQLKITDFGVAKVMTTDSSATVNPVGTPSYMSPEQVSGKPVDVRADVFALGILAYELLTGKKPFEGDTWTAVLFQIVNFEPAAPSQVRPELPRGMDAVIARALKKDATLRTPDVATFKRELHRAFDAAAQTEATMPGGRMRPRGPVLDEPRIARGSYDVGEEDASLSFDAGDLEPFRGLAQEKPKKAERPRNAPVLGVALVVIVLLGGLSAFLWFGGAKEKTAGPETAGPETEPTVQLALGPTEAPEPTPAPARPTPRPPEPTAPPREPTPAPRPTEKPRPTPTLAARAEPTVGVPVAPPPREPTAAVASAKPPELPPPPPSASRDLASIDVISTPPGAEVYVGEKLSGRTPVRIADLEPGHYDFEIRKEGYVPYRRAAEFEPRSRYEMKVTLVPVVNSLRILSEPSGAQVSVNGERKGSTPLLLSGLPNGSYDVEVVHEGTSRKETVELSKGELQEVRFSFVP